MRTAATTIDEYLDTVEDPKHRELLKGIRARVRQAVPEAVECISYAIPAFKYRGKALVYFAAFKSHCSIFGVDHVRFADELVGFKQSKGTIQFTISNPIPLDLVDRMVLDVKAEIDARAKPSKAP